MTSKPSFSRAARAPVWILGAMLLIAAILGIATGTIDKDMLARPALPEPDAPVTIP